MMDASQRALCLGLDLKGESTLLKSRSTGAPKLLRSVTLAPLSKGAGTLEELIGHSNHAAYIKQLQLGKALQTKPYKTNIQSLVVNLSHD